MIDAGPIDAISTAYRQPLKPAARSGRDVVTRMKEESGTPVARWGGANYSVVLYRADTTDFRPIVASRRLEALARIANKAAFRP